MKKRKLFALLLAVVMMLSLSAPAFADTVDDPTTGSITIEDPATGTTYTAYQIFELSFVDTNPRVPTPQSYESPYFPYNYYIDAASPWCATVVTYATNDDHEEGDPAVRQPGTGLVLDPVYETDGSLKGYNVTYDQYYSAADFAAALKEALADTTKKAAIDHADNAKYKKVLENGKADDLPFGYYLVDSSLGALASLTSTDPDVVISDKNEQPRVNKVIVEEPTTPTPLYGETDPKYVAYEIFHKETPNTTWGADVIDKHFFTALANDTDLDSLYTSTYGEPEWPRNYTYSEEIGNTAARKWSEMLDTYIATVKDDFIDAVKGNLRQIYDETLSEYVAVPGTNALNPVHPGSTYLVAMYKDGVLQGYDIVVAGANGKLNLTGTTYIESGEDDSEVNYEAPVSLVPAELEEIPYEVKANGASIGEDVHFKLTTEVPDMTGYEKYFFVVNDKMDDGLTFDKNSVAVYLNADGDENPVETGSITGTGDAKGDKLVEGVHYTVEVGEEPIDKLVWNSTKDNGDGTTGGYEKVQARDPRTGVLLFEDDGTTPVYEQVTEIRIIFKNMLQWRDYDNDTADTTNTLIDLQGETITVTYTAMLNENANVFSPEENTALIEYSKDPTIEVEYKGETGKDVDDPEDYESTDDTITTGITGEGPEDTTCTYTAEIVITKMDASYNPPMTASFGNLPRRQSDGALAGAKFRITGESLPVVIVNEDIFKIDENGEWYLLKDGTFTKETPSNNKGNLYSEYVYEEEEFEKFVVKDGDAAVGDYYLDEDSGKYILIDGTTVEVANVPTNAVIYTLEFDPAQKYTFADDTAMAAYFEIGWDEEEEEYAFLTNDANFKTITNDEVKQYLEEYRTFLNEVGEWSEENDDQWTEFWENEYVYVFTRSTISNVDNYDNVNVKYSKIDVIERDDIPAEAVRMVEGYTGAYGEGSLFFSGLGEGTYTIEETVAPDGFNLLKAPITVEIRFELENPADPKSGYFTATVDGVEVAGMYNMLNGYSMHGIMIDELYGDAFGSQELFESYHDAAPLSVIPLTVLNHKGAELPETGGIGTAIFYTLGGLLVLGAGILFITKKRMGAED